MKNTKCIILIVIVDWILQHPFSNESQCWGLRMEGYKSSHAIGNFTFFFFCIISKFAWGNGENGKISSKTQTRSITENHTEELQLVPEGRGLLYIRNVSFLFEK